MNANGDVINVFLDNCEIVRRALSQQVVADAWDAPAVLDGMTTGALACHLVEASIDITLACLERGQPESNAPRITAAEYYVRASETFTPGDHERFRDRSDVVARAGHDALTARLVAELARLRSNLASSTDDRTVGVFGGAAMSLDEYLVTRLVEQVVHLDDLARTVAVSFDGDSRAEALVLRCGNEIGLLRFGTRAMIRALYRGQVEALPVI